MIYPPHVPLFLSSVGQFTVAELWNSDAPSIGALASAVWPSAGRAMYIPMALPWAYPVKRVWCCNGGTANGTIDIGLYAAESGTRLFSIGATSQSGTNGLQYVSVDWLVQPGEYYLALSLSSGTGTTFRSTGISAAQAQLYGVLQEAGASTLPSTMTPATSTSAYWPLFGLTRTA